MVVTGDAVVARRRRPVHLAFGPSASAGLRIPRCPLVEGKKVPKLSDTQAVLLAAAAARADLSVQPLTLKLKGAALERTLKALLSRGLIAEAPTKGWDETSTWADPEVDAGERNRLIITPAGLALEPSAPAAVPS